MPKLGCPSVPATPGWDSGIELIQAERPYSDGPHGDSPDAPSIPARAASWHFSEILQRGISSLGAHKSL